MHIRSTVSPGSRTYTLRKQIIRNFLFNVCHCRPDWSPHAIIQEQVDKIRKIVGSEKVICGLSGGVDSAVAAALVHRAVGGQQFCIFVDTGLLREGEFEASCALFKQSMNLRVIGLNSTDLFLSNLMGITDPEEKRRVIGRVFIEVFEAEALKLGGGKISRSRYTLSGRY